MVYLTVAKSIGISEVAFHLAGKLGQGGNVEFMKLVDSYPESKEYLKMDLKKQSEFEVKLLERWHKWSFLQGTLATTIEK